MNSPVKKLPGIILVRWARPKRMAVAILKIQLTAEAEIVNFEWEAVPGQEEAAARCAFHAAKQSIEAAK